MDEQKPKRHKRKLEEVEQEQRDEDGDVDMRVASASEASEDSVARISNSNLALKRSRGNPADNGGSDTMSSSLPITPYPSAPLLSSPPSPASSRSLYRSLSPTPPPSSTTAAAAAAVAASAGEHSRVQALIFGLPCGIMRGWPAEEFVNESFRTWVSRNFIIDRVGYAAPVTLRTDSVLVRAWRDHLRAQAHVDGGLAVLHHCLLEFELAVVERDDAEANGDPARTAAAAEWLRRAKCALQECRGVPDAMDLTFMHEDVATYKAAVASTEAQEIMHKSVDCRSGRPPIAIDVPISHVATRYEDAWCHSIVDFVKAPTGSDRIRANCEECYILNEVLGPDRLLVLVGHSIGKALSTKMRAARPPQVAPPPTPSKEEMSALSMEMLHRITMEQISYPVRARTVELGGGRDLDLGDVEGLYGRDPTRVLAHSDASDLDAYSQGGLSAKVVAVFATILVRAGQLSNFALLVDACDSGGWIRVFEETMKELQPQSSTKDADAAIVLQTSCEAGRPSYGRYFAPVFKWLQELTEDGLGSLLEEYRRASAADPGSLESSSSAESGTDDTTYMFFSRQTPQLAVYDIRGGKFVRAKVKSPVSEYRGVRYFNDPGVFFFMRAAYERSNHWTPGVGELPTGLVDLVHAGIRGQHGGRRGRGRGGRRGRGRGGRRGRGRGGRRSGGRHRGSHQRRRQPVLPQAQSRAFFAGLQVQLLKLTRYATKSEAMALMVATGSVPDGNGGTRLVEQSLHLHFSGAFGKNEPDWPGRLEAITLLTCKHNATSGYLAEPSSKKARSVPGFRFSIARNTSNGPKLVGDAAVWDSVAQKAKTFCDTKLQGVDLRWYCHHRKYSAVFGVVPTTDADHPQPVTHSLSWETEADWDIEYALRPTSAWSLCHAPYDRTRWTRSRSAVYEQWTGTRKFDTEA